MTQDTVVTWLQANKLGSHWTINGDGKNFQYTDLTWLDDPATKPTAQELGL